MIFLKQGFSLRYFGNLIFGNCYVILVIPLRVFVLFYLELHTKNKWESVRGEKKMKKGEDISKEWEIPLPWGRGWLGMVGLPFLFTEHVIGKWPLVSHILWTIPFQNFIKKTVFEVHLLDHNLERQEILPALPIWITVCLDFLSDFSHSDEWSFPFIRETWQTFK